MPIGIHGVNTAATSRQRGSALRLERACTAYVRMDLLKAFLEVCHLCVVQNKGIHGTNKITHYPVSNTFFRENVVYNHSSKTSTFPNICCCQVLFNLLRPVDGASARVDTRPPVGAKMLDSPFTCLGGTAVPRRFLWANGCYAGGGQHAPRYTYVGTYSSL